MRATATRGAFAGNSSAGWSSGGATVVPDTPIFSKVYDWSLWLLRKTASFPKRFRHSLTERLEGDTLALEHALVQANTRRGAERRAFLDEADALLGTLRLNVRRSFDLRCLAANSYEFAARALNEIGRLLGAWKRSTAEQMS
jgi:hypothetical protein